MSGQNPQLICTVDPYEFLQIIRNPDGTIIRNPNRYPNISAAPDSNLSTAVLSKDIHINQSNNTWARIFLPRQALDNSSNNKLPLIIYCHAGGFIHCSAASTIFHDFCSDLAAQIPAVVGSVDYRLAPEHRLPAAYDDAVEALHWIKTAQDDWLRSYADLANCFIMGSSSGGNIAYHVGLRVAEEADNLRPMKIRGLILHQPYFGGTEMSRSEIRLANNPRLPQSVSDLMWELALPIGVDRDHEYCNPTTGNGSRLFDVQVGAVRAQEWKILVIGCDGDPLIDRQIEVVNVLRRKGVQVVVEFGVGGYHLIHILEQSKAKELHAILKNFVLHWVQP
ncbi:Alpha/beta hydrolase-3 [Quillaja saponaria]|uniref:Alpha/beta hydrolase-3 n=1 Tax=Quillaja saponaria TaxID=32244 RepID=A0AAD7VH70_QUISA|nr:Alpha/beta hydrolase-3 [Quillaja saponaria]